MRKLAAVSGFAFFTIATALGLPVTALAGNIFIDESGPEGAPPIVTSDSPFFVGAVATPIGPEAWDLQITVVGDFTGFPSQFGVTLLEPDGTGARSDNIGFNSQLGQSGGGFTTWSMSLFSDDEFGNLAGTAASCLTFGCPEVVEDGTFQFAAGTAATTADTWNFFLRSDIDRVPEPASLVLIGLGIAGLGLARRHRK